MMLVLVMSGSSHRMQPVHYSYKIISNLLSGVPHSIQALDNGTEFLLVFDDGSFSEDNTFLATEVFLHNPV